MCDPDDQIRRRLFVVLALIVGAVWVHTPAAKAATGYVPLPGSRLYDSRAFTPFGNGETRTLAIAGSGGVPTGATAVVLNVTAVAPAGGGYITVWPAGQARPTTSNLNFGTGDTIPNAVVVQLGNGGAVDIFNFGGPTHVLLDVSGYFEGGFVGVNPTRLLDTRSAPATANSHVVSVAGRAGVPQAVAGVMLNVTVISPEQSGYTTVHPDLSFAPSSSNLNFLPGDVVANAVAVGLGTNGSVRIAHQSNGAAHYVVDVMGYFPSGAFVSMIPSRVFDTREEPFRVGKVRDGETYVVQVAGRHAVTPVGVGAVVANVTVVSPTRQGYVSVWPHGTGKPGTSVLNFSAGQTRPNMAVLTLGAGGAVNVFVSSGSAHVLIDVLGYFPGTTSTVAPSDPPAPVPSIHQPLVAEWNAFRSVGRTCAGGAYPPVVSLRADDSLQQIVEQHSQWMADSGSVDVISDVSIRTSQYRRLSADDYDWFVLSGSSTATVSDALAFLASNTSFDFCSVIYGPFVDAGVAARLSRSGRKYFTFFADVPSFPSTFAPADRRGLIKSERGHRVVEMP